MRESLVHSKGEGNGNLGTNKAIRNIINGSKKRKKKGKKIEKHTNNNKKELNIFPLIMECFDKLKFRRLIEAVLNGPSTLFCQNALIERLYNRYKF